MPTVTQLRQQLVLLLGDGMPTCGNSECPIPREKLDVRALVVHHKDGKGDEDRRRFTDDGTIASVHYGWSKAARKYYQHYLDHPDEAKRKLQNLCVYCEKMEAVKAREKQKAFRHHQKGKSSKSP